VQYYAERTQIKTITLELFNTFGPGDTRPKIFTLWHNAIKDGGTIDMSPGEQIMDISYIDNIIDGYCVALDRVTDSEGHFITGKSYALMSKERMSLKELSQVFTEEIGKELKINFGALPYREHETMMPMSQLEVLPGWTPKVSLREGIRLTVKTK